MANSSDFQNSNYIGEWTASLKTGRKLILVVHGVIPTSGEKVPFSLKIADPQGIDPLILVLELSPDIALSNGSFEIEIDYSEVIDRYDQYDSVLIRGAGRVLAFLSIDKV